MRLEGMCLVVKSEYAGREVFETERFFNFKCVHCFMRSRTARYVFVYKLHLYELLKLPFI